MKLRILSFFKFLRNKIWKPSVKKRSHAELEREIETLRAQINSIYDVVKEQSTIIVAVTKIQADLSNSVSRMEKNKLDEDCFLIKIPLRDDGIAN